MSLLNKKDIEALLAVALWK